MKTLKLHRHLTKVKIQNAQHHLIELHLFYASVEKKIANREKHYRMKKHYRDYARSNLENEQLKETGYGLKTVRFYFDYQIRRSQTREKF